MIPSIEYLRGRTAYRIVPGSAIASRRPGGVGGALHARRPWSGSERSRPTPARGRRSRCCASCAPSVSGSTRRSCRWRPISSAMLQRLRRRAAHRRPGAVPRPRGGRRAQKIDLGEEWTAMTGLPFVWAFWAGRPGAVDAEAVVALQPPGTPAWRPRTRSRPPTADPTRAARGQAYLRDNIRYVLGRARGRRVCGRSTSSRSGTASWTCRRPASCEF